MSGTSAMRSSSPSSAKACKASSSSRWKGSGTFLIPAQQGGETESGTVDCSAERVCNSDSLQRC
eukprot:2037495-Rhodomonas_salina.1